MIEEGKEQDNILQMEEGIKQSEYEDDKFFSSQSDTSTIDDTCVLSGQCQ